MVAVGGIRTRDLQVMSLTSYLTALPRVTNAARGVFETVLMK